MNIASYHCIAVVGGGGKTSLIFYLAGLLVKQGKKVIVGTTTHMRYEENRPFVELNNQKNEKSETHLNSDDENEFKKTDIPELLSIGDNLNKSGYTLVGVENQENGKISSPLGYSWEQLQKLCDVLLIEADGAKGHPLKVPAEHEPVIPKNAELVIAVVGLDAIGRPIKEVCHRPQLTADVLGRPGQLDSSITPQDVVKICMSEQGLKKDIDGRDYAIVLNKADNSKQRLLGNQIRQSLLEVQMQQVSLGKMKQKKQRLKNKFEVEIMSLGRKKIAVILLAAGNSSRFGRENKLMYPVGGTPMFVKTLQLMKSLNCESISVVTQYDEIAELSRNAGAKVFFNPHPQEGISSSIKIGIKANPQAEAWLFSVCDQPYMTGESLEGLIQCYLESGKGIAAMSLQGKIVNPSIFSSKYRNELLSLTGDIGGKHVIVDHRKDTALYAMEDELELMDIDVPMDFTK